MRDPNRIDSLLAKIGKVWKHCPDMRLGQLLINFVPNFDWNTEDSFTESFFDHFLKELPGLPKGE